MHTSERILRFYEDVNSLGLVHPVAEIHKETKVSKGYISEVLRKIKEPGPDFLDLFYKKFTISSQKKLDMESQVLPPGDFKVTLKDYVDLLKSQAKKAEEQALKSEEREKEYLEIIKSKLISIDASSKEIAEDVSALTTEMQAEHRALMDSVDVAAKQPIGTTRAAAHTVELAYEQEHQGKGKKATGKPGKQV